MPPATPTPRKRGRPAKTPTSLNGTPITNGNVAPAPATPAPRRTNQKRKSPGATPGGMPVPHTYPATFLAAVELLNNLDNFCGIGTLDFLMPRRAGGGMDAPDGWLWLETPGLRFEKNSIEASLQELVDRGMVRCTYRMMRKNTAKVRVYVLPDDVGRASIQRDDPNLRKYLKAVVDMVDVSVSAWKCMKSRIGGRGRIVKRKKRKVEPDAPDHSATTLFYMFNTLASPAPDPKSCWIKDDDTKDLLAGILDMDKKIPIPGVKTELYKYQRRTIAMMLQKELAPERTRDPRLREVKSPGEGVYFWDSENAEIFQEPRYYDDVKGGILAEEMGTGKTLICLAVILASKYQCSYVPEEYTTPVTTRNSVGTLRDMCVAAVWRHALPWTEWTDRFSDNCIKMIRDNPGYYEVPPTLRSRSSRYTYNETVMEKVYLGTGTIIVCPQNLVRQWNDEIQKHLEAGALKILTLAHVTDKIPPISELLSYDIVIFSRRRFDDEAREGRDEKGRRESYGIQPSCQCTYKGATRTRDCICFNKDAVYKSPLMSVRWKRLIVDEGHSMASSSSSAGAKSNGVCVAEKLPVERRWIVTGTPTSELRGVVTGMVFGETEEESKTRANQLLEDKKDRQEWQANETAQLERIGRMVCDFLKQKPWAPIDDRRNTERASWKKYVTKSRSTECVKGLFQKLFIRHTLEDVEDDAPLPPLYIKRQRLEPEFFEKLSMNLFVGTLASNAVTSERVGPDYMFTPSNQGNLKILTNNLKRSSFYSSGYSIDEVERTIKISRKYLAKNEMRYSARDIGLLKDAIAAGEMALANQTWREISTYQDMVYFLSNFPEQLASHWSFPSSNDGPSLFSDSPTQLFQRTTNLFVTGGAQVQYLQKSVNAHAHELDLTTKLEQLGKSANEARVAEALQIRSKKNTELKAGISGSSISADPLVAMRTIDRRKASVTLTTTPAAPGPNTKTKKGGKKPKTPVKSAMKPTKVVLTLPADSPLSKSRIMGTASAKLTYVLNQIRKFYKTEKTLIFYEEEDVAWYLTQALEILGIENLAYSRRLTPERRSSHIATFQRSAKYRVLLMDLNQSSHGLNVSSATRVFFMSPVWREDIEQQALKRAHRIGQTKPVWVETLILKGTLEEMMLKRREALTEKERKASKESFVKDGTMRGIIQNLAFLEVQGGEDGVCMLSMPEEIFGDGKHGGVYDDINEEEDSTTATSSPQGPAASRAAPTVDDRVMSDLPGVNGGLRRVITSPVGSPMKRRSARFDLPVSPMKPTESSLTLEPPRKRIRREGFMGNEHRDYQDTDGDDDDDDDDDDNDEYYAPLAASGSGGMNGRGKKSVRFR